ncbi:hypothetical protein C4565_02740 [Candidatus Parcubacteria bacterium]|jgi:hypothetical protein|nr:MAG: hypothetical protein C4565_02740 [Candidatus Parcubacteria bacterium]
MPKLDTTGPLGQGPMTGRGAGSCNGEKMGRGWGCRGCGRGFGFRRYISPTNKLNTLEEQEKMLEDELVAIREEKAILKNQ